MSQLKHISRTKIFWELTIINLVVIALVIIIAGVSVKEFACFLAEELDDSGSFKQANFDSTMDYYLIRVSLIAFFVAVIVHYQWIKRIIVPVQRLSDLTKRISEGEEMQYVPVGANNEIGELTTNFNQLMDKLKRSEDLRNQMTADLAHEVRTPLSNLTGYLEALKNGVIDADPKTISSLHGEADRLKVLIEQLYHLSEHEWQKRMTVHTDKNTAIHFLVEQLVAIYKVKLKEQDLTLHTSIEKATLPISEHVIKQILGNLIDNAIVYAVEDTIITISGYVKVDHYVLAVSGKGQIIPEEARNQLFERFYRVDQSRNRQYGGSGLGLAIVKELVELQGGKVWLETDSRNHRFLLELPLNSK
ncbi:sensor histidine kinase [Bacillus niameyensis]|uniref:sensor histidine kinase n=1 Tax=Bacillus niameyensis TaxID=1522308 RepID=UPI001E32321C|nr:HAMP domain-containing sensor histidine kinase [Bacillus niameyensis]